MDDESRTRVGPIGLVEGEAVSKGYRFREVRKGEREGVLAFAKDHGFDASELSLRHHLSLVVLDEQGQTLAEALCLEDSEGRYQIEVVTADDSVDQSLINEMADRCLRKVQAEAIGTMRLGSPTSTPTDGIFTDANWLNRVEETPPADAANPSDSDEPSQAA